MSSQLRHVPNFTAVETEVSIPVFIKRLRTKLGLSQPAFCNTFAIPYYSLLNWERGKRRPSRSSYLYLLMIERFPKEAVAIAAGVIEEHGELRHVHLTIDEAQKITEKLPC